MVAKRQTNKVKNRKHKPRCMTRYRLNKQKKSQKSPTLLQQIKVNSFMKKILIKKANKMKMTNYDKFLYDLMKAQKLPKGTMQSLLKKYKGKKLPSK